MTEWILFTVTYFTPGFNEGALWALQMFESSGHLPFLQETIFLLDFYWCKWFCCLQEGMLSTTFPIPVDMCFLLPDYIQPCPQVSQCQASLHLVTLPARNIALSLFQTSLSQSPLDTQLELATRRRVPMFKVVPNIFWSSWCCWWWNAENMGNLECKGSVFVRPTFSCFALCRCRNSILPQHHAAFLFPVWGYGAKK